MDYGMKKATDDFISQRVNFHGRNEPEAVAIALTDFRASVEHLVKALTDEQINLFRDCENLYRIVEGEIIRAYFEAGFGDAISFLFNWKKE